MNFVRGMLDRLILVAATVTAGCVPGFIAQYRQRVGGQLDQVLQDIAPFQEIANQFHHGSLEELIRYHLSSPDPAFHNEGAAIQEMVDAAQRLRIAFDALNTDLLHQLLYLLWHIDPHTARATWDAFSPSFDLTVQSIAFALISGIAVWLVFFTVWYIFARLISTLAARS